MYFLGVTRFSLFSPDSDAWNSSRVSDLESREYLNYLYAPERMEPRLKIFGKFSLPILEKAADKYELRHIVRYSEEMPDEYKDVLKSLADKYSFIVLEPHVNGKSTLNPYEIGFSLNSECFGLYRLDDDDLLSSDFFDQVARFVQPSFAGMRVSLARGVTALYENGEFSLFRECYKPQIAIGLMAVYGKDPNGKMIAPPDVPHNQSDRYGSVVLNAEKVSWLWTRHVGQDTVYGGDSPYETVKKELLRYPAVPSYAQVDSIFPTLVGRLQSRKNRKLAANVRIDGDGAWFETGMGLSDFSVVIEAEFEDKLHPTSALLKFHIADADGNVVPAQFPIEGLSISPYEHIGYYRYLSTKPGRNIQEVEVSVPDGYRVVSIGIQPFGVTSRAFSLLSLAVCEY